MPNHTSGQHRKGVLLMLSAAVVWSFGGAIARALSVHDNWAIVFWRSAFASAFLLGFMLLRDGPRQTVGNFQRMGLPGIGVGLCFATASSAFVVALAHTTVASVLLMDASVPLLAALMAFFLFGERIAGATWLAIAVVVAGVCTMAYDSLTGQRSPLGDGLALLVAAAFASATVITRRHANVGMMPAVCLGCVIALLLSATMAGDLHINARDGLLLFLFGALNLGLGMAFFVVGARLLPSALAALISMAEPVLGPLWVWFIHGEVPSPHTLYGGGIVFAALLGHLLWQFSRQQEIPAPS